MTTTNTLAARIKEYMALEFKGSARKTILNATLIFDEFERFVGRKTVTSELLLKWNDHQVKRGLKGSTINKKTARLRSFFSWCHQFGYMSQNLAGFVAMHKVKAGPLPAIYTEEEYERIKEFTKGTHNYFLTVLGYRTGMSMVDICNLKWSTIDLHNLVMKNIRIKMARFGHQSEFTMPILAQSDLHILLVEMRGMHRDKFGNKNDDFVNPELRGLYEYGPHAEYTAYGYTRMLRKLGITGKSFKNMRNTFISNLANSGMNLGLACKLTGHRDPSVFVSYIRPDEGALRDGLQSAFQWAAGKHTVAELRKPKA